MKIPVKLIKADTAQNFGALMAQPIPWIYKFYWKMESWLQSKVYKSLNSERGFQSFYRRHDGVAKKEPARAPADHSLAFSQHHKPLSHDKPF